MLIIAERINSTRKSVAKAVESRDESFIRDLARKQAAMAGVDFIDVNAGAFPTSEPECLEWLVNVCQESVETPLSLDSPNPEALEKVLPLVKKPPFINSITGEDKRIESVVPLVVEYDARVICLCMDESGIPETSRGRIEVAKKTYDKLAKMGVAADKVYFDPLVQPVSTNNKLGVEVLETIAGLRKEVPESHVVCGLSNVSFGLPERKLINQNFISMCIAAGLDSVILDPLDRRIMANIYASEMLVGRDEFCLNYINAHKAGLLKD